MLIDLTGSQVFDRLADTSSFTGMYRAISKDPPKKPRPGSTEPDSKMQTSLDVAPPAVIVKDVPTAPVKPAGPPRSADIAFEESLRENSVSDYEPKRRQRKPQPAPTGNVFSRLTDKAQFTGIFRSADGMTEKERRAGGRPENGSGDANNADDTGGSAVTKSLTLMEKELQMMSEDFSAESQGRRAKPARRELNRITSAPPGGRGSVNAGNAVAPPSPSDVTNDASDVPHIDQAAAVIAVKKMDSFFDRLSKKMQQQTSFGSGAPVVSQPSMSPESRDKLAADFAQRLGADSPVGASSAGSRTDSPPPKPADVLKALTMVLENKSP